MLSIKPWHKIEKSGFGVSLACISYQTHLNDRFEKACDVYVCAGGKRWHGAGEGGGSEGLWTLISPHILGNSPEMNSTSFLDKLKSYRECPW